LGKLEYFVKEEVFEGKKEWVEEGSIDQYSHEIVGCK
jgi:hypothetical protein